MPAVTNLKRETRKTLILNNLVDPGGCKDYQALATKYGWDKGLTKELMDELNAELENVNTFNRARIAIKASPGAIDRIIDGATTEYTEPEHILKAWQNGLRTIQGLDPKFRSVHLDVQHQGNVLLRIANATKSLLESIDANYEVLDPDCTDGEKIEPGADSSLIDTKSGDSQV